MPEYDLGTAHGRIKIDVDDRGARQADSTFVKLEQTMRSLDARLASMQTSFSNVEKEIQNLASEFRRANDEAEQFSHHVDGMDRDMINAARHTREWTRDLRIMSNEIERAINAAERFAPPLLMIGRFIKGYNNNGGGIQGFFSALGRSGAAVAGLSMISRRLMGVEEAMKNAPRWQKNMLNLFSVFNRFLAIGGFLNWISRGAIGFFTMGKAVEAAGRGIKRLGSAMLGLQMFPQLAIKMEKFGSIFADFYNQSNTAAKGIRQMVSGFTSFIVGSNMMKNGIGKIIESFKKLGWAGKIAITSLAALGTIGPAALELLSKGLVKASNLIASLANGVKQLSGGFLALPGAISMMVAGISTIGVIFKGLGEKFKDIFGDDLEKANEAIEKLPPSLKKIGAVFLELAPKVKDFQKAIQENFFAGADQQIKILADGLMPRLQDSMLRVSNSLRIAKDRFVEFAATAQTGKDISRLYGTTAQTINTLSAAIKPAMSGMRDISLVGAQFINALSAGVPGLVQKFADWAAVNRQNGNLMKWMQDSWTGVKNLATGMRDLIKATWTLLTLFATDNGENALSRFADAMKRFNETVKNSAASGVLRDIANAVKNMGTDHLENLKRVVSSVWETMKVGWPIVEKFVHQIGTIMSKAIEHVLKTLRTFLGFFNKQSDITIFDGVVAVIKGMVNALKAAVSGIINFTGSLKEMLGPVGDVGEAILRLFTGFEGIANVYGVIKPVFSGIVDLLKELLSTTVPLIATIAGLAIAFALINKVMGPIKGVFRFFAGIVATFKGLGNTIMGASAALNMFGAAGARAALVTNALFRGIGFLTAGLLAAAGAWMLYRQGQSQIENANKAISDSSDHTRQYVENLKKAFVSDKGIAGENVFTAVRDSAQQMLDDLGNISENTVGVMGNITDFLKGGNGETLSEKLGAPDNSAWKGFTQLIPIIGSYLNAPTGNSDQVNRLQEMAKNAKDAKAEFESLGMGAQQLQDIITGSASTFETAKNLLLADGDAGKVAADKIQQMRDAYLQTEAAAKQLGPTGSTLVKGLQEMADAAGNADKKLNGLRHVLEGLGLIKVDSLQAAFDWAEGLAGLESSIQSIVTNGANLSEIIDKTTGSFNTASPAAKQLFDVLKPLGDQFLATVAQGGDPGKAYEDFATKFKTQVDVINQASQAAGQGVAITEEQMRTLQNAVGLFKPDELKQKLDQALSGDGQKKMLEFGLSEESLRKAREAIDGIVAPQGNDKGDNPNTVNIPVQIDPKSNDDYIKNITELIQSGKDTADKESQRLEQSGYLFGEAFARGITSTTALVDAAASALTQAAIDNYHQSPPKKGPLARRGDAVLYAGTMFGRQYARGIDSTGRIVAGSAAAMAGGAYDATSGMGFGDKPGSNAGKFLGQILDLTNFASQFTGVIQKISDTIFKFAKFMSDPMQEGSFFGKNIGYKKTVPDSELQRRENDRLQAAAQSMLAGGQRDLRVFNDKLSIVKNAQNAVVDQQGFESKPGTKTVGAMIKEMFPEIATIGGARADPKPFHPEGRALDVMIPDFSSPEGKALGDRINSWALSNSKLLGIDYTIWQDFFQPGDGSQGNFMGNKGADAGHFSHVHINFATGAQLDLSGMDMTPEEQTKYKEQADAKARKKALSDLQDTYGPPTEPGTMPAAPTQKIQFDENGNPQIVTEHGTQNIPLLGYNNPETALPYTQAEITQFQADNPMQFQLPDGITQADIQRVKDNPQEFNMQTQDNMLKTMSESSSAIAEAIKIRDNPKNYSESQIGDALVSLDSYIKNQKQTDTAASRSQMGQAESLKSSIMDQTGMTQNQNPIDQVAGIANNAVGVASDIIGTIVSGIESVGAADDIAKTLVRGMSGTQDVTRVIDDVQKFIELGANIAGSVASVSGMIGGLMGAAASADPTGGAGGAAAAVQGVSTIASLVQAGFETANAIIDISQEAMKIAGSYFGDFLGYLVGGPNGPLSGNVRFLLDQQTNQLLTYSTNNPLDKRAHDMPFSQQDQSSRQQMIGNINMYGGPGSDPRDMTRQMMFQVNSAQYAGALAQ